MVTSNLLASRLGRNLNKNICYTIWYSIIHSTKVHQVATLLSTVQSSIDRDVNGRYLTFIYIDSTVHNRRGLT